jgi:hypothetical protein
MQRNTRGGTRKKRVIDTSNRVSVGDTLDKQAPVAVVSVDDDLHTDSTIPTTTTTTSTGTLGTIDTQAEGRLSHVDESSTSNRSSVGGTSRSKEAISVYLRIRPLSNSEVSPPPLHSLCLESYDCIDTISFDCIVCSWNPTSKRQFISIAARVSLLDLQRIRQRTSAVIEQMPSSASHVSLMRNTARRMCSKPVLFHCCATSCLVKMGMQYHIRVCVCVCVCWVYLTMH